MAITHPAVYARRGGRFNFNFRMARTSMKRKALSLLVSICILPLVSFAQTPAPGPYYFVSDNVPGPNQFYWGGVSSYGGVSVIENYNLLASVLGDEAVNQLNYIAGWRLVPRESFDFGSGTVTLQPFAYTSASSGNKKRNLPRLRAFLNDPLGGTNFDLSLPFSDDRVALSDRSALLRVATDNSVGTWHIAADLDVSGDTTAPFKVFAPADGTVEGNSSTTGTLCLKHTASNGKEFLTIYAHMDIQSKRHLKQGLAVHRGDLLGIAQSQGYTHLHFGVAVKGPKRKINGTNVPELWYLIDPFGVYDYRRNRESTTDYNYLPNNTLDREVRGIRHAYVWRTNPPIRSLHR